MGISDLRVQVINGIDIFPFVNEVAKFRIKYFIEYPYLYVGNVAYEENYLKGYSADSKALLIMLYENNVLKGVSTALPLVTNSDILDGAPEMFRECGLNPNDYYYFGEIILDHSHRGKGISRPIYQTQENYARENGYSKVAIATVERSINDARKPMNYLSSDLIFQSLGFKKTSIKFNYSWPTILESGEIKETENQMVYWTKDL